MDPPGAARGEPLGSTVGGPEGHVPGMVSARSTDNRAIGGGGGGVAVAITHAAILPSGKNALGGAAATAAVHSGVPRIRAKLDSVPSSDDQHRNSGCSKSSAAEGRWASRFKHDKMTLFTSQSIIVVSARGGSPVVTLRYICAALLHSE